MRRFSHFLYFCPFLGIVVTSQTTRSTSLEMKKRAMTERQRTAQNDILFFFFHFIINHPAEVTIINFCSFKLSEYFVAMHPLCSDNNDMQSREKKK